MILYNWKNIHKAAKGNAYLCVLLFDMLVYRKVPKNKKDILFRFRNVKLSGKCFMARPENLLDKGKWATKEEIAMYIALASYRNLGDYVAYKTTTLELIQVPISQELFKANRLLRIKNGLIHFIYEEITT